MNAVVTEIPFGWNPGTPLIAESETTDTEARLDIRDTNGAWLVTLRLTANGYTVESGDL